MRDDLADVWGPEIFGSNWAQIGFDLASTTGNMAPSIAASVAGGPAAGAAVTFASAGGNAYGEALARGYDQGSARAYGILAGASEAGLQYALGGISALGGKVINSDGIQAALNNIKNAALRIPAKYAVAATGEMTEEYLQEILDPVFRNLALGENNEFKLFTEDAAYSALLAALSVGVLEGRNIVRTDVNLDRMGQTLRTQWGEDASGVTDVLIRMGLNQEQGSDAYRAAQAAQNRLGKGGTLTNVALGSLYQDVMGAVLAEGDATIQSQANTTTPESTLELQTAEPATMDTTATQNPAEGAKTAPGSGAVNPGARESIRELVGDMPSDGYDIPHISMPNDILMGEDGTSVPESKLPSVIRKYMLKLFRGKVLKIGRDNKVYISRDGIKEFAFPAKRIDGEVKEAKMTAGANLDTTLAPAAFLTNTPDDGRHPQATGGWDNFYVMFETDTGIYSGIVKTMVTDRGRVFYDITEIQREGDPTTHGDNGASPPPARTDTPSMNIIPQPPTGVNLRRSLPGDIPADIPPGLRKLYRLAQEMSTKPQPREIPRRPVQQSPQEILTRLAQGMARDSLQGGALDGFSDADLIAMLDEIAGKQSGETVLAELNPDEIAEESDIGDLARRTAKSLMQRERVVGFAELPRKMRQTFESELVGATPDAQKALQKIYSTTDYVLVSGKRSRYVRGPENVILLSKYATPSTLAHELFHKLDQGYKISRTFIESLAKDSVALNVKSGGDIAGYLLQEFPEAFVQTGLRGKRRFMEQYRGISDIINGLTDGQVFLGAGHKKSYWKKANKLEAEAWAQFGRVQFENQDDVLKMFQSLFPNFCKSAMIALKELI